MEEHIVKILNVEPVTHDVRRITVRKPDGYRFVPGQATEVAINNPEWKAERRPFTFTSMNDWKDLEFTIKIYDEHKGVTEQIGKLSAGDELLIHDVWGAVTYQGKGVFIAGGAGITPFISIFRQLEADDQLKGNKLVFSNKTAGDIILQSEFERMLGPDFRNVLTREKVSGYHDKRINEDYLKGLVKNFGPASAGRQHFYICGPEQFTNDIQKTLIKLGADAQAVIIEK